MAQLTDNQKQRIMNIEGIQLSSSILGGILGVIYSHRTGGGSWRGVGYYFLGSISLGLPTMLITTPFKNKIIKETANKE